MLDMKGTGKRIRALRKQKEVTQFEAAAAVGISRSFWTDIELGATPPSLATLAQIADYFGVSCAYLLGELAERNTAQTSQYAIQCVDALQLQEFTKLIGIYDLLVEPERDLVIQVLNGVLQLRLANTYRRGVVGTKSRQVRNLPKRM